MTGPITLNGVANFRDFGGYSGARGPLRRGRHFRSGHLAFAKDEDLAVLESLDLRTVVDLRRLNEREKQPSRWTTTLDPVVVSNDLGFAAEAPHVAYLASVETMTPDAARTYLLTGYRSWPYEERH
ncbi:MAG: protein tyrosine/serine phosphatase, partial [Brevundimonas sp.]|nr:protein tyrosine/serine phosphatase [Brevundimonas sp.]